MKKIQISLTEQEEAILQKRADKYGYSIHRLIKLLVGREVIKFMDEEEKHFYTNQVEAEVSASRIRKLMDFH